MKYKQLNTKHPNYDEMLYKKYNALYEGGIVFEELKDKFLTKNEFEPPQIFKSRKDNAEYQNFVGPIIDQFAAQLFSSPFKIVPEKGKELDSFYTDLQSDVDGGGTDLINFMQSQFIKGVVNCAWYVAEMPQLSPELQVRKDNKLLSIAEMDSNKLRQATVCEVDICQIYDYEVDNYKKLSCVKIYKCESLLDPKTMDRSNLTETWKIYNDVSVDTYQLTHKKDEVPDEDQEVNLLSSVKHGFAQIPVMRLQFPAGLQIMNRVASAQIGHFRSSAQLDWAQRNCAFPMPVFKSTDRTKPPVIGAGRWLLIDAEEDFSYEAPKADSFASLAERIESKRVEIFRVTQQMAAGISNTAVIGRSADSKAMDSAATEICLQAYGRYVKEAVEELFEVISNGRGDAEVTFSVEGMNQFNSEDVTSTMANLKEAKTLATHSPTLYKNIELKISDIIMPDLDYTEKQLIVNEIQSAFKNIDMESLLPAPPDKLQTDKSSSTKE